MALIRWEPVPMNRLFNNLFDTPTAGFGSVTRSWIPALDIVENDDDYVLRADLPGLYGAGHQRRAPQRRPDRLR